MNKIVLPIICFLALFTSKAIGDEYENFWEWFVTDQNQYYSMNFENRSQTDALFDKLSNELTRIDENLTFEFGKLADGRMDFVISAGGIEAAFPHVITLVEKAPKLDDWEITAFRQAKDIDTTIEMGGAKIDPKSVLTQLFRDNGRIGIVLYIPGFKETPHQIYEQLGFLLLDQTLGEYVVGTKVGFVEFKDQTGNIENAIQLKEIPKYF